MKKVILCVAVVTALGISSVQAQTQQPVTSTPEQFKQEKGDICVEIQFRPFTGSPIRSEGHTFALIDNTGGIFARFFATDKFELNAGLTLGIGSRKNIDDKSSAGGLLVGEVKQVETINGTAFGLGLGANYHLNGTKRISPFVGAGLGFGIENGSTTVTGEGYNPNSSSKISGGIFYFDFGVVTGFDFYVVKGLYLGAGVGLLFQFEKPGKTTVKTTTGGGSTTETTNSSGANIAFGFAAQPAIRLGWKF